MDGDCIRVHSFVPAIHFDGLQTLLVERAVAGSLQLNWTRFLRRRSLLIILLFCTSAVKLIMLRTITLDYMSALLRSTQLRGWCSSFLKKGNSSILTFEG